MKKFATFIFLIFTIFIFPQQAADYFPSSSGYLWNYKVTPLDSVNNPLVELEFFRKDSFALVENYQGRLSNLVLSKEGHLQTIHSQQYIDSNYYSFEGTIAFEYFSSTGIRPFLLQLDSIGLDTNFNFVSFFKSLENWYSVYRFSSNVGSIYTLLQKDTTISTFNIRFRYAATRNSDETINTMIGTFNCKKFTTQWDFSVLIGPFSFPLFSIEDTVRIAPGNWIVRAYQPSKSVDLSLLGIPPFNILGRKIEILDQIVSIKDEAINPNEIILYQNYPNPFNPTTKISWQSPIASWQSLKVYDILGNEIAVLVDEYRDAGSYEIKFSSENISKYSLPSGIYFYRLQIGDFTEVKKMVLLR